MRALAVPVVVVLKILVAMAPEDVDTTAFQVMADAIAVTASRDPLWPEREDGAERTAAVLLSLAKAEGQLNPRAVGDQGRSLGLYQILQPVWKHPREVLFDPLLSTPIANDLVRRSFVQCGHRPWRERLSWYAASSGCVKVHPVILEQSRVRMELADKIFAEHFVRRDASVPGYPSPPSREAGGQP